MKVAHHATDDVLVKHITESVHAFLAKAEMPANDVKVEIHVGHPFLGLLDACHRFPDSLLVLGTRGSEHGPNEIGAIAAMCVRKAPADVLLVRVDKTGPFEHVTACVDLSETSAKAVRAARLIAEDDKASLDCLFVYQSAAAMALDYGGFAPALPVDHGETADSWRKDVDEFVQPLLRTADGLKHRNLVMERLSIREAIFEHARESKTDLVVLGTRGKTDLRTLIMGTTAEKIVAHAPCSILAVKPDGFVYPAEKESLLPPATGPLV
jgi:nucleotide-binding universal stress UspA family protein